MNVPMAVPLEVSSAGQQDADLYGRQDARRYAGKSLIAVPARVC
jgi:hypothetical protein